MFCLVCVVRKEGREGGKGAENLHKGFTIQIGVVFATMFDDQFSQVLYGGLCPSVYLSMI